MLLADTSAWIWSRRRDYPDLRASFDEHVEAGEIWICEQVRLELLAGEHSSQVVQRRRDLDALESVPITRNEWQRALEVQSGLAQLGTDLHKGIRPADLLIAAIAERSGLELLHYDVHFERIQRVTKQPMRWLAAKGTLR